MISKELYEEVQKDYIDFKNITQDEYIIIFNKEEETVEYVNKHTWYKADSISIYKLAHECKEWATENKYTILTENMYPNGYFAYVLSNEQSIEQFGYLCENKVIKDIPHNKTEPEAIFKATSYIMEQLKQKD